MRVFAIFQVWLCFQSFLLCRTEQLSSPHLINSQCIDLSSNSSKYVSDPDLILSAAARTRIADRLRSLDEDGPKFSCGDGPDRGFQFVVALVDKLGPGVDIEKFSYTFFNRRGIGYKECNNGILLVLARQNRKNYVRTGRGARRVLTDAHAAEILASLKPHLRAADYDTAIEKAVQRIIDEALSKGHDSHGSGSAFLAYLLIGSSALLNLCWESLLLAIFGILMVYVAARKRKKMRFTDFGFGGGNCVFGGAAGGDW